MDTILLPSTTAKSLKSLALLNSFSENRNKKKEWYKPIPILDNFLKIKKNDSCMLSYKNNYL
jgi:hypothetical protein